jgi:hypothetical protein
LQAPAAEWRKRDLRVPRGGSSCKGVRNAAAEWWKEEAPLPDGKKWRFLEHNGVIFPPEYQPHGVKMRYVCVCVCVCVCV